MKLFSEYYVNRVEIVKEWLEQLPDSVESLRLLNTVKDIEERVRMHRQETLVFIQYIKRYLEEDYVSYIVDTELQYIEIGLPKKGGLLNGARKCDIRC